MASRESKEVHVHKVKHSDCGTLYILGVLGAAIYFVKASHGFWDAALGILKAFFWPAFLVYRLFQTWGM
jgi:hypothetical protein